MGQETYSLKYYIYDKESRELLSKEMEQIRLDIHHMFPELLKEALALQQYKNILLILNAKVQEFKEESEDF